MKQNEDFTEDEQPQEEFNDPLPDEGEAEPDKDIFGSPEKEEDDINYRRIMEALRAQDMTDAFDLRATMQMIHQRTKQANSRGKRDILGIEGYIAVAEKERKRAQQQALAPEIQAETEKRSLENGVRGMLNRARKRLGMKIKISKNIDQDDVYRAVEDDLKEKRIRRSLELQERIDSHIDSLEAEETGYLAREREYQMLVRAGADAIHHAEERKKVVSKSLQDTRIDRDDLAKKLAAKPYDSAIKSAYRDTLDRISRLEEEEHELASGLKKAYADLRKNRDKHREYKAKIKDEREALRLLQDSMEEAMQDREDFDMLEDSGSPLERIKTTLKIVSRNENEAEKADKVLQPGYKAVKRSYAKVREQSGVRRTRKRRSFVSGNSTESPLVSDIAEERQNRELYRQVRVEYG